MATNLDKLNGEVQADFNSVNFLGIGANGDQSNGDPNMFSGLFTFGTQEGPALTTLSNGLFAETYSSFNTATDYDIILQLYNPDGTRNGVAHDIATQVDLAVNPDIAPDGAGGAAVVWATNGNNTAVNGFDINIESVTAAGVPGVPLTVFNDGATVYDNAAIARFADGHYFIAGERFVGTTDHDVSIAIANSTATALTSTFTFSNNLANNNSFFQGDARVATFGNTGVVVYEDGTPSSNARSAIALDVFNSTGTHSVIHHVTNNNATANLANPDIAALTDGRFIITWTNELTGHIFGEFYDSTTDTVTSPFSISGNGGVQEFSRVAALPDGGFTVTWNDTSGPHGEQGGFSTGVVEQRFDANGVAAGDAFLVNTVTASTQFQADVAANSAGNLFVAWEDFSSPPNPNSTDVTGDRLEGQALVVNTDTINGTANTDNIVGTSLGETIHGNNGDDVILGNAGNDNITGDGGNDNLLGGDGNDTIDGGDGNDGINGGNGDDVLTGGAGSDNIFGGNGDDFMDGGADSDIVRGEDGNDTVHGGDGFDIVQGDAGDDQVFGDGGDDRISGGLGNDSVDGGDGDDWCFGEQGNDTVVGGNGDDHLFGGTEDDLLQGGAGNDFLDGQAGNDTMDGGSGNDVLTGEGGIDTYVFNVGMGQDTIGDFGYTYNADNSIAIAGGQNNEDHINVASALAPNFAFIQSHASQVAGPGGFPEVVIDFGGGNSLTLLNFHLSDLAASDFTFT